MRARSRSARGVDGQGCSPGRLCHVLIDRGFWHHVERLRRAPKGVAKMNHSTGHGVGLEVHEEPALRETSLKIRCEKATVVTVEPGLYKLGLGGSPPSRTPGWSPPHGFQNFTTITRSLDPKDYL